MGSKTWILVCLYSKMDDFVWAGEPALVFVLRAVVFAQFPPPAIQLNFSSRFMASYGERAPLTQVALNICMQTPSLIDREVSSEILILLQMSR